MAHKLRTLVVHSAYAAGFAALRPLIGICVENAGDCCCKWIQRAWVEKCAWVGLTFLGIPTQDAGVLVCAVAEQPGASQWRTSCSLCVKSRKEKFGEDAYFRRLEMLYRKFVGTFQLGPIRTHLFAFFSISQ